MKKNIFLGLDIGTNSVGYAVTDEEYNVLKCKGNALWGVNLFDEANQATDRRAARSGRRRLARRKQRIDLLRELLAKAISKVDCDFYKRLDESALYEEDKELKTKYSLFDDNDFNDKKYHDDYPTIHHLIVELINNKAPHDVRLVYLACAYILKHRGHFLIEVDKDNVDGVKDIKIVYENFTNWFKSKGIDEPFECSVDEFGKILKEKTGVNGKEKKFKELLWNGKKPDDSDKEINYMKLIGLFSGRKIELSALFKNESYKELENDKVCVSDADFEETVLKMSKDMEDGDADLLFAVKAVADWAVLNDILDGVDNISESKVKIYDKHKRDLKILKHFIIKYVPKKYKEVFKSIGKSNYTAYSGNVKSSGKISSSKYEKAKQEDFCKYIGGIIKNIVPDEEDLDNYNYMHDEIENKSLCPLQKTTDNRVIPYQLLYDELNKILTNASEYISELNETDKYGTVKDKILSLMTFRIPYYVGPLVSSDKSKSKFAWMVRKEEGRILPWNFDEKIDKDKSENEFIRRMTCKCTYVAGEDVLPKYSLLYSKYNVLNEINNLTINDKKIDVDTKQNIYNDLFLKRRKVTRKKIEEYLITTGVMKKDDKIGGIDITIKSSLSSYHDFKNLLTEKVLSEDDVEEIIKRITMTTDKKRLKKWLAENYDLSEEDLIYVSKLKYNDFGRLSGKLLTGIKNTDRKTGEVINGSIMSMLWETNENLMQLLSSKYHYSENIEYENNKHYDKNPQTIEERLDEMYVSNAVKRPIMRTLAVVKDISRALKCSPDKIFIEMARDTDDKNKKGKRTKSRKETITEYFAKFDDDEMEQLKKELETKTDEQLRSEKLYLYFMQLGKCMYSGKNIDINRINQEEFYNVDHIYPQARIKDDSLNNKVLVLSKINGEKGDNYPINPDIRDRMTSFWTKLHKCGMVSDEKYKRLTRNTRFTDEELAGFINRQLVETRQSTKAVATLLKDIFPDSEIVYVKADLASDFRHKYDFPKSRDVNDFHHAKDAYLNIVMGNVYDTKFTKNPINFIKKIDGDYKRYSMNMTSLLKHNIERGGNTAWIADNNYSFEIVKKHMNKNNIHYVRYSYIRKGVLFNLNPERAKEGLVNRKKDLPADKYGGYNSTTAACFVVAKYYTQKNNAGVAIAPIEAMYLNKFLNDNVFAQEYLKNTLSNIISLKKGEEITKAELPLGKRLLKINTMIDIDGFKANITCKEGGSKYVGISCAVSLILDKKYYDYVKKLSSFNDKLQSGKRSKVSEEHDKITFNENVELYDELIRKINRSPYNVLPVFTDTAKKFELGKEKFLNCKIEEQLKVLLKMVNIMKTGRSTTCDLRLIGDVENAAKVKISVNISKLNQNSIRIIDQSDAGIYEKVSPNLKEL